MRRKTPELTVTVFGREEPLGDVRTFQVEMIRCMRWMGLLMVLILPAATTTALAQSNIVVWCITMVATWAVFGGMVVWPLWKLEDIVIEDHIRKLVLDEGRRRELETTEGIERRELEQGFANALLQLTLHRQFQLNDLVELRRELD